MTNSAVYFREYNQKPNRKKYLAKKSLERYHKQNKGTGKIICPNCSTVCELQLNIKK